MQHRKITDADIARYGMVAEPDRMTGTAAENKAVFDRLVRECVKVQFNALSDDLSDTACAASLGAAGGTVQQSLDAKAAQTDLTAHTQNVQNPHGVTKAQIGLSAVADERQYSAQNPPPYPVVSVSLDGTTLTPDETGKVNIPLAVAGGAAGALKVRNGEHGLYTDANGELRVYGVTQENITCRRSGDKRQNSIRPLTTATLDFAVKSALCDGVGAAWSASERAAARARMSTADDTALTHLDDITAQSAGSSLTWEAAQSLRTLYVHITVPVCTKVLSASVLTSDGTVLCASYQPCSAGTGDLMLVASLHNGRLHARMAQTVGSGSCPLNATPNMCGKVSAAAITGFRLETADSLPDGLTVSVDGVSI